MKHGRIFNRKTKLQYNSLLPLKIKTMEKTELILLGLGIFLMLRILFLLFLKNKNSYNSQLPVIWSGVWIGLIVLFKISMLVI
jgi:hypothetical protein